MPFGCCLDRALLLFWLLRIRLDCSLCDAKQKCSCSVAALATSFAPIWQLSHLTTRALSLACHQSPFIVSASGVRGVHVPQCLACPGCTCLGFGWDMIIPAPLVARH